MRNVFLLHKGRFIEFGAGAGLVEMASFTPESEFVFTDVESSEWSACEVSYNQSVLLHL